MFCCWCSCCSCFCLQEVAIHANSECLKAALRLHIVLRSFNSSELVLARQIGTMQGWNITVSTAHGQVSLRACIMDAIREHTHTEQRQRDRGERARGRQADRKVDRQKHAQRERKREREREELVTINRHISDHAALASMSPICMLWFHTCLCVNVFVPLCTLVIRTQNHSQSCSICVLCALIPRLCHTCRCPRRQRQGPVTVHN